ncbi:CvfB family protein [Lactobacillus corticis]|uniref:S1 RNA-binding protein n=1 Tax=Lactobacillus corticis TaxID=2201249 RepID=A0A916VI65_9LACO|nr:S1-like domain-containing RNA-binding protein [Lactobacillus corticis]GFZ26970.1 S1 RNA-binding protein [Lactobacillus corticis]
MLGQVQTGKITDENKDAFFVQVDGITFELKKHELTQDELPQKGDLISGFCYENKKHQKQMTQFLPFAQIDQYGWGKVTEVRPGLGVFVDVGLPDKDVALSMDDLPREKERWPKRDDRLLVSLIVDEKERVWCNLADENVFEQLAANYPNDLKNKDQFATVYASREIGAFVLTKDYYLGFIHVSQMPRPLRLGEEVKARVIGFSQYGRLNMSILPRAFEEISDDAGMILMSLRRKADKSLPFYDKSDASEIKAYFGISKGAFKRAVGNLLKRGIISEDKQAGTITLIKDPEDEE